MRTKFYLLTAAKNHSVRALYCTKALDVSSTSGGTKCASATAGVKPFSAIPGPRGPFGLGNLYSYLPLVGRYSWQRVHEAGRDKYERYGAIVRERMMPGLNIVWLYDPRDIALLLNERDHPQRRSHLALEKYRKDRPHIYRSAGLLPTNGMEWWRLRSEVQKEISAPRQVRSFLVDVDKITREFLQHLPVASCFDALPMLSRLNLELTCLLTFNARLHAFTPAELASDSRSSRLLHAAEETISCILPTDQGLPLWRLFETPTYRRLRVAQEYMESVALELVAQRLAVRAKATAGTESRHDAGAGAGADAADGSMSRSCLIEEYLQNPQLALSDVMGTAADFLLAGIDTTSYSMGFALHHVARHPAVQQRLHEEAVRVLPTADAPLCGDVMRTGIPYTRAVLKEVLRLNPISVGVGRILNREFVFSGYRVPPGTVVVTQNMVACRLEKNFAEPLRFWPERWLERRQAVNPYLVLPFGHGMRACIARRLAEQNMLVLLLRLMRQYELQWMGNDGPMDVRTLLINKPSEPVAIRLQSRSH